MRSIENLKNRVIKTKRLKNKSYVSFSGTQVSYQSVATQKANSKNKLKLFSKSDTPVFWIAGPPFCGKTTLADYLAEGSPYYLIVLKDILEREVEQETEKGRKIKKHLENPSRIPNRIIVDLLKQSIYDTCDHSLGYIIDGFPIRLKQARLFERKIRKVNVLVYLHMHLDAFLARAVARQVTTNVTVILKRHVIYSNMGEKVYNHYKKMGKAIKLHSNYPPESVLFRAIENLNDFFGYKFHKKGR